jgi:hypothetical protein
MEIALATASTITINAAPRRNRRERSTVFCGTGISFDPTRE